MATTTRKPRNGYPLSNRELRKLMGINSTLYDFLRFYATRSVIHQFDDFTGDTINLDLYAVANGGGASAASFAISLAEDGMIRATTGTANDATASASLIGPLNWYGDRNCGIEIRAKASAVASVKLEFGFIDGVPSSNAPGVTDEDTPTAAFADGAVISLDSSETSTVLQFTTKGSTASQDIQATVLSSTNRVPNFTSGTTPVLAEWFTVRVEIIGNMAYAWANGKLFASHDTQAAGAVEGGVALAPWIYVGANSATSRTLDVDYIRVWKDRNASTSQDGESV